MLIATLPQYLPYEMVYIQSAYTLGSQEVFGVWQRADYGDSGGLVNTDHFYILIGSRRVLTSCR